MSSMTVFRLIFLVVFLGWLMIWVMLPTKVYKNAWTPKLNDKLNSTYFEEQGTNLLLFSFPVMFIAAFGCVYLHLQKNLRKPNSRGVLTSNRRLSFLRRPALVMAPLGIVTAMELAFAAMFIALLIWSLANYLWQAKFRSVSLRLGYIGNICWAFLFFPCHSGIFNSASRWTYIRVQYQAFTYGSVIFL
ncbi:FERRIC REDUCTION OXIDASE 4-RELATED [Salix purpurea]|uniref:FERRIC REDUCTION OXIDASE 4-RELATED n=1 Tax=Salix purpurea TaxID=77065 RepID=A0A9Q0UT02_SALPP|nr:FERRIC REDUCTION OXIDASE 4-RELATED [Salix purpurea]